MRRIDQLSKSELVTYSKVIIAINKAISKDFDLRYKIMSYSRESPRYLQFIVSFDYYIMFTITFDREKRNFSYSDILIPDGLFEEAINFSPI